MDIIKGRFYFGHFNLSAPPVGLKTKRNARPLPEVARNHSLMLAFRLSTLWRIITNAEAIR